MQDSGLSSWRDLGAHVHQYPHFFITLYENLAVPNVPGVQQRWEVYRQAPKETGVAAGVGTTSKSDAKTRGGDCLIKPSQMEVAPLHRTFVISHKRRLFKNTKGI